MMMMIEKSSSRLIFTLEKIEISKYHSIHQYTASHKIQKVNDKFSMVDCGTAIGTRHTVCVFVCTRKIKS